MLRTACVLALVVPAAQPEAHAQRSGLQPHALEAHAQRSSLQPRALEAHVRLRPADVSTPTIAAIEDPAIPVELGAFLGTGLGSLVGLFGGVLFGEEVFYPVTGCCGGGDDPGLLSNMAFGAIGSIVGGGIGGYLGTRAHNVSFRRMLAGSAGGAGAGLVVIAALSQLDADATATVAYFVTQAAFNAVVARAAVRR